MIDQSNRAGKQSSLNPFTPIRLCFCKLPLPALNLDMSTVAKRGASQKTKTACQKGCQSTTKNRMSDSVDPVETAHYETSNLNLQYLQKYVLVCRAEKLKPLHVGNGMSTLSHNLSITL